MCPLGSDIRIMSSLHNVDASMMSAAKSVTYKCDRRRNESGLLGVCSTIEDTKNKVDRI